MTGRERILSALNHKEPDKIPVDCGSMRSTGIMGLSYNNLKKHLGIMEGETKMYDVPQELCIPEQWYLDKFQIDSVDLSRAFADDPKDWKDWNLPDGSPAKLPAWLRIEKQGDSWIAINEADEIYARMPPGIAYFSQEIWPLNGVRKESFDDLSSHMNKSMWAYMTDMMGKNGGNPDYYSMVKEKAKKLYNETDYAIMVGFGGNLFEWGQFLYRTDEFLVNLMIERAEMEKMLDKLLEIHLENLEKLLEAVSPYVHIIQFGDDLGAQSGPMINPEMYREIFYPRHKKMYQMVKDKTDMKVFLHCCGSIVDLIPDLIDAGVDILNPVQIGASGMEPETLKREFGKDLVFWGGGVDTQHVLPNATPQQVRDDVRKNSEIFMKDGGFVFNQVHNIVAGVPPENILAMYDEVNSIKY